ncbi:MAG: hypothetical protein QM541_12760 [Flavobacterium sp.]|nr:hypothetical protein [Flavobacterium sp.]
MKKIIVSVFVFCCFVLSVNAQNSIVGKWKPVSFSLQGVLKGDLSKDNVDITASLDSIVKKEKDPQASKMMLDMFFQMLFSKMKTTTEEYTTNGKYLETNTKTNNTRTGVYTLNASKKSIERKSSANAEFEKFTYTLTANKLILKTKFSTNKNKQSDLEIVYERM